MIRRLALAWTLAMLVGLSLPGEDLPALDVLGTDKLLHAAGFAAFGLLWLRAYPRFAGRILAIGLLFAALSEVYQYVVPIHRSFSPFDALADAVGLAAGLGLGLWWQRRTSVTAGTS